MLSGRVEPFMALANSDILEYRRTAAVCFASFTLHESNKSLMVRVGAIQPLLSLALDDDLATKRDATFAIANMSDRCVDVAFIYP